MQNYFYSSNISNETWAHIFSFCDLQELKHLSFSCKNFNKLISTTNSIWEKTCSHYLEAPLFKPNRWIKTYTLIKRWELNKPKKVEYFTNSTKHVTQTVLLSNGICCSIINKVKEIVIKNFINGKTSRLTFPFSKIITSFIKNEVWFGIDELSKLIVLDLKLQTFLTIQIIERLKKNSKVALAVSEKYIGVLLNGNLYFIHNYTVHRKISIAELPISQEFKDVSLFATDHFFILSFQYELHNEIFSFNIEDFTFSKVENVSASSFNITTTSDHLLLIREPQKLEIYEKVEQTLQRIKNIAIDSDFNCRYAYKNWIFLESENQIKVVELLKNTPLFTIKKVTQGKLIQANHTQLLLCQELHKKNYFTHVDFKNSRIISKQALTYFYVKTLLGILIIGILIVQIIFTKRSIKRF